MMKKLLLSMMLIVFALSITAQVTLYEDDFESYTVGQGIAAQSPWWITWPGYPDATVVTDQAQSGTKSIRLQGTNDVVLILDKVSGKYEVNFSMFVATGYGGYFNFQRLPAPGVEWVIEVYFSNNGTGYVNAGGPNAASFTFPHAQWFFVQNVIDLDEDEAELHINGVHVLTYQWSKTSQGANSPHGSVLGGLNLFSGAPQGVTPRFFTDDVFFIEISSGTVPEIALDPQSFDQEMNSGDVFVDHLGVSNIGTAALDYHIEINYHFADAKRGAGPINPVEPINPMSKVFTPDMIQLQSSFQPAILPASPENEVVLNYDGPWEGNAIGLVNPNQWEVAARFPHSMTLPFAGLELTKVSIYLNHTDNCSFKIRVYGEGTSFAPGELLHEQVINPTFPDWYDIMLTTPVTITGEDIWVGYWIDQTLAGIYPAGCDAGPAHPEGDYIRVGAAGWGHLSGNPDLNYNWNIRATLTGDIALQWLSVESAAGMLEPGSDETHHIIYNSIGLAQESYEAILKVKSNDPVNSTVIVPVSLDITGVAGPAMVGVNPTSLSENLLQGETSTQHLELSNTGQGALTYSVEVEFPTFKSNVIEEPVQQSYQNPEVIELVRANKPVTGQEPDVRDDKNPVIINYDGPNNDAIGLSTGGTFSVAARFPNTMMGAYTDYTLNEVEIYINDIPSAAVLKVWGQGSATAPGALLHQQNINPGFGGWLTLTLNQPVAITGADLWIGYTVTHGASQWPAGCDAGPAHPEGAYISTDGVVWNKLFQLNPQLNYNWNIRGVLFPEPTYWLTVSPASGFVGSSASQMLDVMFNTAELAAGEYTANIHIHSNDPVNATVTVPVSLIVRGVGINEFEKVHVLLYPVPTSGTLNVQLSEGFRTLQLFNLMGQLANEVNIDGRVSASVDVSGMKQGVYMVRIIHHDGSSITRKIVIGQ